MGDQQQEREEVMSGCDLQQWLRYTPDLPVCSQRGVWCSSLIPLVASGYREALLGFFKTEMKSVLMSLQLLKFLSRHLRVTTDSFLISSSQQSEAGVSGPKKEKHRGRGALVA